LAVRRAQKRSISAENVNDWLIYEPLWKAFKYISLFVLLCYLSLRRADKRRRCYIYTTQVALPDTFGESASCRTLPITLFGLFWNDCFQNLQYVFLLWKCTLTGWAKSRRALDCLFTIMAEMSGRYWQILDPSGNKIFPLSSLVLIPTV